MVKGKVYIASMNLGNVHIKCPENSIKVNVTSAQAKNNANRIAFSPMTPIKGGYKGYLNFEHYWQSGKVFENVPHEVSKAWWKSQTKPKRRYPKAKTNKVLYAKFDAYPGEEMDYVTSRKKIYVPEYFDLIKNSQQIEVLKKYLHEGKDITIYDFDGPRDNKNKPICKEVTKELLSDKIEDTSHPFGHGYIVAAYICGIEPKEYI